LSEHAEDASEPKSERKQLRPFGGLAGAARADEIKRKALLTLPRQECFDRGYITVKDLDDEELVAGRCRDANGRIPKPKGKTEYIPRHLYDEMVMEHELRYKAKLRENLDQMLDVMVEIANDDTVEPRDRFEAAKYIFERTAGKTPETVTVNVKHAPWEELLSQVAGIAPMTREEHRQLQAGIVDAELVEVDEVDEDYMTYGDIPMRGDKQPNEDAEPEEPYQEEPERNYGRRADEKRSYQEQVHDAQALQKRRKEAKAKIQNAKKQRKIDRALGADAIKSEITGITYDEDGKVKFVEE
jgi:hypothetical protein